MAEEISRQEDADKFVCPCCRCEQESCLCDKECKCGCGTEKAEQPDCKTKK